MSVFRVKLTNTTATRTGQGNLDVVGQSTGTSIQRTMQYAMGPGKVNRKLRDGVTFTDCNYWKRFAYPQVALNDAFIEVVTDDGSVYVDGQISVFPRVYTVAVAATSAFGAVGQTVDVLGDNGGAASFTQIKVVTNDVEVRINGLATAILTILAGTTQTFESGDLSISTLEFRRTGAGAATATVTVGVQSVCNS